MCGRITITTPTYAIADLFEAQCNLDIPPRYNVAPSQEILAVRADAQTQREMVLLKWGLIPFWAKDAKIGNKMINAKAETVHEKPAFRAAFRKRRCIIPADGFYEWKTGEHGKQPYYIHSKQGRAFAFAGLYETWNSADNQLISTCTIITTKASPLIAELHDRMPVILQKSGVDAWLDPTLSQSEELAPLLLPYQGDDLDFYPVSHIVGSPMNDRKECTEKIVL